MEKTGCPPMRASRRRALELLDGLPGRAVGRFERRRAGRPGRRCSRAVGREPRLPVDRRDRHRRDESQPERLLTVIAVIHDVRRRPDCRVRQRDRVPALAWTGSPRGRARRTPGSTGAGLRQRGEQDGEAAAAGRRAYAASPLLIARSEPMADASLPDMRARSRPGTAMAAMMPMMATTISSSISVKPFWLRNFMSLSPSEQHS